VQRGFIHQPVGTIKRKPTSITAETYKQFLIGKFVPATMKRKWLDRNPEIVIQQDGASSPIEQEDP
jgi:hypothetical protein